MGFRGSGGDATNANHVTTALAILGSPAASQYPPTDRHLPLLLGALLNVVESEIALQLGEHDPEWAARVLDGFLAQPGPARPLELAALRLDRTAVELSRSIEGTAPGRQVLDVAHQASRCASIALMVHLAALDGHGYRPDDDQLQAGLVALEIAVTDVINRFNEMVAELHQNQP